MNKILTIALLALLMSCSDSQSPTNSIKPEHLKLVAVADGVKLSWKENKPDEEITYQVYSKIGGEFKLIGFTKNNDFTDYSPTVGENTYRINAIYVSTEDLISEYSDEVSITMEAFEFVASYKNDVRALYYIKNANPQAHLAWEFDDIDSDNPVIKNYSVTPTIGAEYDLVVFKEINGEKRLTELVISKSAISDLSVINRMTALTYLNCSENYVESLDVSKNIALTRLDCSRNSLYTLDVSKNTALLNLSFAGNALSVIDISSNTFLTRLDCSNNKLYTLDVSKNTALTRLDCSYNWISALNIKNNTALIKLSCTKNKFTTLDITSNIALASLNCERNALSTLDISKNRALENLSCAHNSIASLDVSNNTALTSLDCLYNSLTVLDVSKNIDLTSLGFSFNSLTAIDVSNNTLLTWLIGSSNLLTTLDVSKNRALTLLVCDENPFLDKGVTINKKVYDLATLTPKKSSNIYKVVD